ncbi:MAG: cyclic nucleotide-binding domain-containing protein [Bacilli bacterium]|jgi:CRP-like cAMP-binding protein|nr:cyclic nucleotide-binding domain-containing protein [Bacilli bacterium]
MGLFNKKQGGGGSIPQKTFGPGEVVIYEGDHAICMFDIIKGQVGVYKNYGTPNQKELAILREGDYFGEMAVIENQPRNATIVVLEKPAVIQVISSDDFFEYVRQNPTKIMLMLQRMGKRINSTNGELRDAYETIYDIDQCKLRNLEPGRDLSARIKMYANRYQKMK